MIGEKRILDNNADDLVCRSVNAKEHERQELDRQVQEFLKKGGKIQVIESGVRAKIDFESEDTEDSD